MPKRKSKKDKPHVVAKCVGCGATKKIYADDVAPGDQPMCNTCYMPMVAVGASSQ